MSKSLDPSSGFGTKAIHAGCEPDSATGAMMTPIYQTSTFKQESPGEHKGYEYARVQNPTRHTLEKNIAAIENGQYGFCFGSGMAASDNIIKLLKAGDEVIATHDLYGGTYRLFTKVYEGYGIKFKFVDMQDLEAVQNAVSDQTKMLWVETPTNPTLSIVDIQSIAQISKQSSALLVVDNTFATPYLQNPLDLGADIVMHSATKYLGGHSDVVLGAIVCNDRTLAEELHFYQKSCGGVCGPQDAFLVIRGIKTLHLRMERHSENGMKVAEFLQAHPKVKNVYYPGLVEHKNHAVASKQMKNGFGGMVSFDFVSDKEEDARMVLSNCNVFSLAESLGGVESLMGHPATMTHASIPREERLKAGIVDSMIRLSVGVEDVNDLIKDLEQALSLV